MTVPKPLKFCPDYECSPIWWDSEHPDWPLFGELGCIDPESLGLSDALTRAINAWAEEFDNALDWDDPAGTQIDEAREAQFRAEGERLWQRLVVELEGIAVVRFAY